MTTAPVPFQGAINFPAPPPRPPGPSPGPLPIMAELDWLREAVDMGQRTIKYLMANYNSLLAKAEAEGVNVSGALTFGPPTAYAPAAIVPPGQYLVTIGGSLTVTPDVGQFIAVPQGTTAAATAITLMPVS